QGGASFFLHVVQDMSQFQLVLVMFDLVQRMLEDGQVWRRLFIDLGEFSSGKIIEYLSESSVNAELWMLVFFRKQDLGIKEFFPFPFSCQQAKKVVFVPDDVGNFYVMREFTDAIE